MKVTKHGNTHESWKAPTTAVCTHCHRQVADIEESDLKSFDNVASNYIKCPECQQLIDLP